MSAGFIQYTETATASGSLNGVGFTNSMLTITATADTSQVSGSSGFFMVVPTLNSFTISGIGSGSFLQSELYVFVNQSFSPAAVGFSEKNGSILDTFNTAFATYGLTTAIGPTSGSSFINSGMGFTTTSGTFILTSTTGNVTFSASTSVPEPASLLLCGIGGAFGLVVARARRKRA